MSEKPNLDLRCHASQIRVENLLVKIWVNNEDCLRRRHQKLTESLKKIVDCAWTKSLISSCEWHRDLKIGNGSVQSANNRGNTHWARHGITYIRDTRAKGCRLEPIPLLDERVNLSKPLLMGA